MGTWEGLKGWKRRWQNGWVNNQNKWAGFSLATNHRQGERTAFFFLCCPTICFCFCLCWIYSLLAHEDPVTHFNIACNIQFHNKRNPRKCLHFLPGPPPPPPLPSCSNRKREYYNSWEKRVLGFRVAGTFFGGGGRGLKVRSVFFGRWGSHW